MDGWKCAKYAIMDLRVKFKDIESLLNLWEQYTFFSFRNQSPGFSDNLQVRNNRNYETSRNIC